MDTSLHVQYARTVDGSITERTPPPVITITTASGEQIVSHVEPTSPCTGVITTTEDVRRYGCTFRSKQDKQKLRRFRKLQKARGHR